MLISALVFNYFSIKKSSLDFEFSPPERGETMTSKGFLTVAGLVMMLQGVLFIIFSQDLTKLMFPYASAEGVRIGTLLRELMAGGSFFIGILLFSSRTNTSSAANRMLWAACFGFALILLLQIKLYILDGLNVHILAFLVSAGLALTAMFIATSR